MWQKNKSKGFAGRHYSSRKILSSRTRRTESATKKPLRRAIRCTWSVHCRCNWYRSMWVLCQFPGIPVSRKSRLDFAPATPSTERACTLHLPANFLIDTILFPIIVFWSIAGPPIDGTQPIERAHISTFSSAFFFFFFLLAEKISACRTLLEA